MPAASQTQASDHRYSSNICLNGMRFTSQLQKILHSTAAARGAEGGERNSRHPVSAEGRNTALRAAATTPHRKRAKRPTKKTKQKRYSVRKERQTDGSRRARPRRRQPEHAVTGRGPEESGRCANSQWTRRTRSASFAIRNMRSHHKEPPPHAHSGGDDENQVLVRLRGRGA